MQLADESIEDFRKRIAKMSDAELVEFGKACAEMADPEIQGGRVEPVTVVHLQECRAEWRRRHSKQLVKF